jgi:hypothetical protein
VFKVWVGDRRFDRQEDFALDLGFAELVADPVSATRWDRRLALALSLAIR